MSETLLDLGEREIVRRLEHRGMPRMKDPSAMTAPLSRHLAVRMSFVARVPAPRPVGFELGYDNYYYWGWLLVALNVSDINAAGATPTGFMTSLTLPPDFPLQDFNRLLDGIDEACAAAGTEVMVAGISGRRPRACLR